MAEVELCRDHVITGFPSIRVFRKGSDELNVHGIRDHESYRGDRTKASLLEFADALVPSAGQPHHFVRCGPRPSCLAMCVVWSLADTCVCALRAVAQGCHEGGQDQWMRLVWVCAGEESARNAAFPGQVAWAFI